MMDKFYGNDIDKIKAEYLLKATPFHIDTRINFSKKLDQEIFFNGLYADSVNEQDPEINEENYAFDKDIQDNLECLDNKFAKVDLIHIVGYGGCGKTTYIRHLLWNLNKKNDIDNDIVDFEGTNIIKSPFVERISMQISKDIKNITDYLKDLTENNIFNLSRFNHIIPPLKALASAIGQYGKIDDKNNIEKIIYDQENLFGSYNEYIYYLVVVDFLLQLLKNIRRQKAAPAIIVFDNVDSISDLSEEIVLVSVLKNFVNDCNFFIGMNVDREGVYNGKLVSEIIDNVKFIFFLTTRIVSIKKYLVLEPELENVYGWISLKMPEHYYSHRNIISKRVKYYIDIEGEDSKDRIQNLKIINDLANVVYRTYNFKRLFNGNIRFCFDTLCKIYSIYSTNTLIYESMELYGQKNEINEAAEGASGIILSLLLNYFQDKGVYSDKLHLSECQSDHKISLSRIILTILREKGGACSLLDMFELLSPTNSLEDICNVIWDLNEAKREYWRRLITFDVIFPKDLSNLYLQAEMFRKGNYDVEEYSEINICTAGRAYIDYVVPHFEFMLSRHRYGLRKVVKVKYQPLFCKNSEDILPENEFKQKYRFERKIDWVLGDVETCCYNSVYFANSIMQYFNLNRYEYINNSYYNYHTTNRDKTIGYRQSYESRLIFSHIGYIERYRRYLLKKNMLQKEDYLKDINERLITRISKYLNLYLDENLCFQTKRQDDATKILRDQIKIIKDKDYLDFKTKIEIS